MAAAIEHGGAPRPRQPNTQPGASPAAAPRTEAPGSTARLPRWWHELILVAVIYGAYTLTRGFHSDNIATADRNGRFFVRWEAAWHIDPERWLNNLFSDVLALNLAGSYFYATLHYIVTPIVLIWVYRRVPNSYRTARTTLAVATVLALVGFWLVPTTPPRLLPGSTFHDALAETHDYGWWGDDASAPRGLGGLTNQFAAMPSLHVGWALWCAWFVARNARHRAVRVIGALYPLGTTIVVMGTGNHYLLDAVAGAVLMAIVATGVWASRRVKARRRGARQPVQVPRQEDQSPEADSLSAAASA